MTLTAKGVPESSAAMSLRSWLEEHSASGELRARGADLLFAGETELGPTRLTALSPFSASAGVAALCVPRLVRAEIGEPRDLASFPGSATAWAPWSSGYESLELVATGEGWTAGVLLTPDFPAGLGEDYENAVGVLPHPFVKGFLSSLAVVAGPSEIAPRQRLWEGSVRARRALVPEPGLREPRSWVKRIAKVAFMGAAGAATAAAAAASVGVFDPVGLPAAAGVGALASMGIAAASEARLTRIRLWPLTRAILDAIEGTEELGGPALSAERHTGWVTRTLTADGGRGDAPARLLGDNGILAESRDGRCRLRVDTFSFVAEGTVAPEALVAPPIWSTVELTFEEGELMPELPLLAPLRGTSTLVGWLREEEIRSGRLRREILEPLAAHLRRGTVGPYR